jgi:hypothetical protein
MASSIDSHVKAGASGVDATGQKVLAIVAGKPNIKVRRQPRCVTHHLGKALTCGGVSRWLQRYGHLTRQTSEAGTDRLQSGFKVVRWHRQGSRNREVN